MFPYLYPSPKSGRCAAKGECTRIIGRERPSLPARHSGIHDLLSVQHGVPPRQATRSSSGHRSRSERQLPHVADTARLISICHPNLHAHLTYSLHVQLTRYQSRCGDRRCRGGYSRQLCRSDATQQATENCSIPQHKLGGESIQIERCCCICRLQRFRTGWKQATMKHNPRKQR
jgi:hypothetical protein